jgi:hypothetical protein
MEVEKEDAEWDDTTGAEEIQHNNGGTLGRNLGNASEGKEGTINDFYRYPGALEADPRDDSSTSSPAKLMRVLDETDEFPYHVAAHHLIPGEASLAPSELYTHYMVKDASIDIETGAGTKSFTIGWNIGYNVNGAHNGVWLPGNYALRARFSYKHKYKGQTWEAIADGDFKTKYSIAAMKKSGNRQFHDAHVPYNEKVLSILNKMAEKLMVHQAVCEQECKSKTKLNPPYRVKLRLYEWSGCLKRMVVGNPNSWKYPYFTSGPMGDKFRSSNAKMLEYYQNTPS